MFKEQIRELRDLARWAEDEGAKTCATGIGDAARNDYQLGRSPAGDEWAPRKADGAYALLRAPEHVTFRAVGDAIEQEAPDHYRFHRTGTRKMVKRNVYSESSGALPPAWQASAERALLTQMERRTRALGP